MALERAQLHSAKAALAFSWITFHLLPFHSAANTHPQRQLQIEWRDRADNDISSTSKKLFYSRSTFPDLPPKKDPARFRVLVRGVPAHPTVRMTLVSFSPQTHKVRHRLDVPLMALEEIPRASSTPWLVVVPSREDYLTPAHHRKAIYARPRDKIKVELRLGGSRPIVSLMSVGAVGIPSEDHPIVTLKLKTFVLKDSHTNRPIVGDNELETKEIVKHQVEVMRDVFAQCAIDVDAGPADVQIIPPPQNCLLAIGDQHGLVSKGGLIRFTIDNQALGPFRMESFQTPLQTAEILSQKIEAAGFHPSLSINRKLPSSAFASVDIVIRRPDGQLANITSWPNDPLSTDVQQTLHIGSVHSALGVDSYDQTNGAAGTLEERTLVKCLTEHREKAVHVFIINELQDSSKQGESFTRNSAPPMSHSVIIDRQALMSVRQSYTLSHEVGHVLLNDLDHPDSQGDYRSYLLMHSRSSSAIGGPKHITEGECAKMRSVSKEHLF